MKLSFTTTFACFFTLGTKESASHSWVECTDYDMDIDLSVISHDEYDPSDCNGFIRDWDNWEYTGFGDDHGQDTELRDSGATKMCERTIGDASSDYGSTYTDTYPMAQYKVGETYRMLWPAKNHANYECNEWENDNSLKLYVNLITNPTEDVAGTDADVDGWTLIIDYHEGYERTDVGTNGDQSVRSYLGIDDVGFQNCPNFCGDGSQDLAICYQDFTVPDIFPEDGYYTFLWYWDKDAYLLYSSCWEAYVSGTGSATGTNNGGANTDTDTGNEGGNSDNELNVDDDEIMGMDSNSFYAMIAVLGAILAIVIIVLAWYCFVCRHKDGQKESGLAGVIDRGNTNGNTNAGNGVNTNAANVHNNTQAITMVQEDGSPATGSGTGTIQPHYQPYNSNSPPTHNKVAIGSSSINAQVQSNQGRRGPPPRPPPRR